MQTNSDDTPSAPSRDAATQIEWRDPALLHPHPATKHLHILADDNPTYLRIVASIERDGFCAAYPLVVDEHNRIMDGRHRWKAAKRLQLASIPVLVKPSAESAQIIRRSILGRKHYSQSAIAFELYPLFEKEHQAAVASSLENLKKGQFSPSDVIVGRAHKYVEDLAKEMGVGVVTFKLAARVHSIFRDDPAYAELMLPRLYGEFDGGEHESTRPVGLGAIVAGHATFKAEDKSERFSRKAQQLELFSKSVKSFVFQCGKLDASDEDAQAAVRARLEDLTPEELERIAALADLLKSEVKRAMKRAEGEA